MDKVCLDVDRLLLIELNSASNAMPLLKSKLRSIDKWKQLWVNSV